MSHTNDNIDPSSTKHKFSTYFYNWTTYFGVILSLVIVTIEIFLFILDFLTPNSGAYLGLITYLILPPFLILGLILIPIGALRKRRRVLLGIVDVKPRTYFFDPSLATHRNGLFVFMLGSIIIILMSAVGSYKAFHYTESVKFCGITCHGVMKPEYTLYQQSDHANVKCVECHIGPGADSYMKSKINGAMQVVSFMRNSYERPIPAPVHNLRPAEETCAHCHWPGKLYNTIEQHKIHYPIDEYEDKSWVIRLSMRVGGAEDTGSGIHAHMNKDNDIFYYAVDQKRQEIPWVKSVDKDGKEVIYLANSDVKEPPADKIRKMDCIDCHNRPSHSYKAPNQLINEALKDRRIDSEIPKIKQVSMAVLSEKYKTEDEAIAKIPAAINKYYNDKENEYYSNNKIKIEKATQSLIEIYKNNFFPEMNARWDSYPDNKGHLISPGCFRCHDGEHKSTDGKVISNDCTICHMITEQGPSGKTERNINGLEFKHPFNGDESWKEMKCYDCHTGN